METRRSPSWIVASLLMVPVLLGTLAILVYSLARSPAAPGAPASAVPTTVPISATAPTSTSAPISPSATAAVTEPWPDFTATANMLQTLFPVITPNRPTGIFDAGAELWHEGYRIQNAWAGPINGVWAYVLAGAYASNDQRGVLQVTREYPNAGYARFFDTPSQAGSVKIMAESGFRLTLQSANGTVFYFDIPSETFVTDLTQVAATLPPPATRTPTAAATLPLPGGYPGLDGTPVATTVPANPP